MKNRRRIPLALPLLAALLALCSPLPASAADAGEKPAPEEKRPPTLAEAISGGELSLALRYRLETVSDDAFAEDAEASTLRTALAYRTGTWRRASFFLEVENVTDLGLADEHNNAGAGSLGNRVTNRPVVADPEITEVNQAYLRLDLGAGTALDLGRREILLDNVRWVGNVGWRQNHQSYDAVTLVSRPHEKTSVTYAYLDNVNRIFGDSAPMASHLLNIGYEAGFGKLTGYAYLLDYDEARLAPLSTSTYGLRLAGARGLAQERKLRYEAEYARQRDAGDNPGEVDADYYRLGIGADAGGFQLDLVHEVLGADKGRITTPLATLHAHNGWADKFLATPPDGLVDSFAALGWGDGVWSAKAVYHRFEADRRGGDYGSELDLELTRKLACGATLGAKAALYDADGFGTETEKLWLWAARAF